MYIKEYKHKDGYTIYYLCCSINNEEIVLGWLDKYNKLHPCK